MIILDFDGTLTDTDREAAPYLDRFHGLFCGRTGIDRLTLEERMARIRDAIAGDPTKGWTVNGQVVAPATADPYVLNTTIYGELLRALRDEGADVPAQEQAGDALLVEIHTDCYKHTETCFRPGAKEFLEEIEPETLIVTNSSPETVLRKLAQLGDFNIPVVGNAKKYEIDDTWTAVPASVQPTGFPRPVLLRRAKYKQALESLCAVPRHTTVMGDIYELDLALPAWLGYNIIQLKTPGTQPHEATHLGTRLAENYTHALGILADHSFG